MFIFEHLISVAHCPVLSVHNSNIKEWLRVVPVQLEVQLVLLEECGHLCLGQLAVVVGYGVRAATSSCDNVIVNSFLFADIAQLSSSIALGSELLSYLGNRPRFSFWLCKVTLEIFLPKCLP